MTQRVVVIGSGASGLVAAVALACLDADVTVVERAPVVAPLLRGFSRQRHYCDLGLHYSGGLAADGFLTRLFDRLGVRGVEPVALDPDGFDRLVWPDEELDLLVPGSLDGFAERLTERFPASAGAVRALAAAIAEATRATPFLNPAVPPWDTAWEQQHGRTGTAAFIRAAGGEEALAQLVGRYGEVLHGLGPDEAPLLTNAIVLGSYLASAHTVRGGGLAVVKALQGRLAELGGTILTGRAVTQIVVDASGRATGVRCADGETVAADAVVFTAHPAHLPGMLPASLAAMYERRTSHLANTTAMFLCFFAAADEEPVGRRNSYVFLPAAEAAAGSRYVAVMAGSPPRRGFHSSLGLIRDLPAGWLPDGGEPGRRADAYRAAKRRLADETLAVARRHGLVDDTARELVETVSPQSFTDWTATPDGSAYGAKRLVTGRRLNPVTPVENLVLAGQSLLYPGIMGAAASALVACGPAVGPRRTWELLLA